MPRTVQYPRKAEPVYVPGSEPIAPPLPHPFPPRARAGGSASVADPGEVMAGMMADDYPSKWMGLPPAPPPAKPNQEGAFVLPWLPSLTVIPAMCDWWRQASEPYPPRPPLRPGWSADVVPELPAMPLAQPMGWWRQPHEAYPPRPALRPGGTSLVTTPTLYLIPDSATWYRPASEPLRPRHAAQLGWRALAVESLPDLPLAQPLGWFRQPSEAYPPRPAAQIGHLVIDAHQLTLAVIAPPLDSYWRQPSEPYPPRPPLRLGSFVTMATPTLFQIPDSATWWRQPVEAFPPRPPLREGWHALVLTPTLFLVPDGIGWWHPASEPLAPWPSAPLGWYAAPTESLPDMPLAQPLAWHRQPAEPLPPRPAAQRGHYAVDLYQMTMPEAVSLDRWFRLAPDVPGRRPWHYAPATTEVDASAAVPFAWWLPASEPIRPTPAQQATSGVLVTFLVETWWHPAPAPVPPPVPAAQLGQHAAPVIPVVIPAMAAWYRPASEPYPPRPAAQLGWRAFVGESGDFGPRGPFATIAGQAGYAFTIAGQVSTDSTPAGQVYVVTTIAGQVDF